MGAYAADMPTVVLQERTFVSKVYGWMAFALFVTAMVAMGVANTPAVRNVVLGNRAIFFGLIIGELVLVIALSAAIARISAATATIMFVIYSAVNGLTLSVIFVVYTDASIASTFFITGGTFAAMSVYGYTTKRDLTSIGNLCFMALIGLILASLVNIFLQNAMLYWVVTYVGILIFVGLVAYDTQRIKQIARAGIEEGEAAQKGAILGALRLYLDFINLFLLLLRIFGRRR